MIQNRGCSTGLHVLPSGIPWVARPLSARRSSPVSPSASPPLGGGCGQGRGGMLEKWTSVWPRGRTP
eukprot:9581166-Prorocentrum_lima.AAC.1